jgi:ABC-type transport system substrate-binding protein
MRTPATARRMAPHLTRRELLTAGLAAGATFALRPLARPPLLWGGDTGQPKRGGILRVRGWDPVHFDPQLTRNFKTNTTLSFVYSKLLRHKVGAGVPPGTFLVEPDLAERWEAPDDMTYLFHLRKGVRWHNKPPLNGRELVAASPAATPTPQPEGTLTVPVATFGNECWLPHLYPGAEVVVLKPLMENLLSRDANTGELIPLMAERWEVGDCTTGSM